MQRSPVFFKDFSCSETKINIKNLTFKRQRHNRPTMTHNYYEYKLLHDLKSLKHEHLLYLRLYLEYTLGHFNFPDRFKPDV